MPVVPIWSSAVLPAIAVVPVVPMVGGNVSGFPSSVLHDTAPATIPAIAETSSLIAATRFDFSVVVSAESSGGLYNNAAQVWNHTFFWNSMKPNGGGVPSGSLAEAIHNKWGSLDEFKKAFQASAVGNFGSGWTWLVKKADGSLDIVNMGAAGTPLTTGDTALLTVDVWEHAYYIDYRNLRAKFVEAFLNHLVNWDFATANYKA